MKNITNYGLLLISLTAVFSNNAIADASATWTCTGKNVVLKSITPYMGEDSKFTQTLFVLQRAPVDVDDSVNTGFYLKVEHDMGKFGSLYISGKNEVGGKFQVQMAAPVDVGDGTTIHYKAKGTINYSQGPTLSGKNEKVDCELQ